MKNYISGIVVVITGRTAGFGLSSAQILRELGAQVAVTGRNLERLQAAERQLASDRLLAVQADAVSTTDWREMIRRTLDRFGRIGVLVNNHGAGVKIASIEEMSDEDIQTVLELRSEPFCSGQRPRNDRHPHKSVDP